VTCSEPELELPHPRLLERPFALVPAAEVAPDLVHPGVGRSLRELARTAEPLRLVAAPDRWERAEKSDQLL